MPDPALQVLTDPALYVALTVGFLLGLGLSPAVIDRLGGWTAPVRRTVRRWFATPDATRTTLTLACLFGATTAATVAGFTHSRTAGFAALAGALGLAALLLGYDPADG